MIYAEILAGGSGKRFGNKDLPKQFMMLSDKPIIIHTIEQFVINKDIDKIIVCTPKNWISYTEDLIKKYINNIDNIEVVEGGSSRNESMMNGCRFIKEKYGLKKDDIIITHDAVRPFINQRIIEDSIKVGKKNSAVDTVIPATDTIIKSEDGKLISDIPDRSTLYYGQTPQTFNIIELMKLYESLTLDEKNILTDACKIFVLKGKPVKMIEGETFNIKITTVFDLKLADSIVMVRKDA